MILDKFFPSRAALYAMAGLVAVIIALGVTVYTRGVELDSLRAQLKVTKDKVDILKTRAGDADLAIRQCSVNLAAVTTQYNTCSSDLAISVSSERAARAAEVVANQKAAALSAKITIEREKAYGSGSCSSWGSGAVCGAISDGLLDHWGQASRMPPAAAAGGGETPAHPATSHRDSGLGAGSGPGR